MRGRKLQRNNRLQNIEVHAVENEYYPVQWSGYSIQFYFGRIGIRQSHYSEYQRKDKKRNFLKECIYPFLFSVEVVEREQSQRKCHRHGFAQTRQQHEQQSEQVHCFRVLLLKFPVGKQSADEKSREQQIAARRNPVNGFCLHWMDRKH